MRSEDVRPAWFCLTGLLAGLTLLGCGSVHRGDEPDEDGGGAETDASPEDDAAMGPDDASAARCDPDGEFSPPVLLDSLSSGAADYGPRLTSDELTAYLASSRTGESRAYAATRASVSEEFAQPVQLPLAPGVIWPTVTDDGLTLYAEGSLDGTVGKVDIWRATRKNPDDPFGALENVAAVNSEASDANPFAMNDGVVLYFMSRLQGSTDIYRAEREGDDLAAPDLVLESAVSPVVTPDERRIFIAMGSPLDIWTATRDAPDAPFGEPEPVDELNSAEDDRPAWISGDGCRIYFASGRPGGAGPKDDFDLYFSERAPL
jgi:WD40-like Beta Propeller Repeat